MRKAMAFPVRFVAEGQTVQTTSRDLDEESVFVRCVEPPAVGEQVGVRLYLPGFTGAVETTVVESTAEGFRARFGALAAGERKHLEAALRSGSLEAAPVEPLGGFVGGDNRRLLPRYLDKFRVTLSDGAQTDALNISATGLFIRTDAPPELDQIVQVIVDMPDGKPAAQAQALVLRRVLPGEGSEPGAGVQFIAADDAFRQRLDAWLEQLRASDSRPSR